MRPWTLHPRGAGRKQVGPRSESSKPAGRRIGLVGCVAKKLPHPARARDLFISQLFAGRVSHVAAHCDEWLILSAEHGLIEPDQELAPYDEALKSLPAAERRAWSDRVLRQLRERLGSLEGLRFEVHAGREYWAFGLRDGFIAGGASFEYPVERLGIGQQLAWYDKKHAC